MLENVSMVEDLASTNGNIDKDLILVNRTEFFHLKQKLEESQKECIRLEREREEYREIALSLGESVPKMHEISENIDEILTGRRV